MLRVKRDFKRHVPGLNGVKAARQVAYFMLSGPLSCKLGVKASGSTPAEDSAKSRRIFRKDAYYTLHADAEELIKPRLIQAGAKGGQNN